MKIVIERMHRPDHDNFILRDLKSNTNFGMVFCDLFYNQDTKKNEFVDLLPGDSAVVEVSLDYKL